MKRLAVLVFLLTLTAGCAAGGAAAPSTPASAPSQSATPSPSGASVAQWASAIAPLKAKYDKSQKLWDDATCSAMAANSGAVDCSASLVAMQFQAATFNLELAAMSDRTAKTGYLGEPPAEIAAAYHALADAAGQADTLDEDPIDCPGKNCLKTAFAFEQKWEALGDAFAAWEPWL